jgi:hypothetical protein
MRGTPPTDPTTIILALLGFAIAVAVGAIHIAGWKHRLLVWGLLGLAAAMALVAVFWVPLSAAMPAVAAVIGRFASSQFLWFLALLTALISTVSSNLKVKRLQSSSSTDLATIDREWRAAKEINDRLDKLEKESNSSLQDEFLRLHDTVDSNTQVLAAFAGDARRIDESIAELERATRASIEKLGELNNQNLDYTRRQISSLYDALSAVYHRERLLVLDRALDGAATELASPIDKGERLNEAAWNVWQTKEAVWRDELRRWAELASCYVPGIGQKVLTTNPEHYKRKGHAKADQFPDTEAYIAYKEFFALWKNWYDSREDVRKAVHRIAFDGGTANERPVTLGQLWLESQKNG